MTVLLQRAKAHLLPILSLLAVTVAAFTPAYAPVLYSDDWGMLLRRYLFGHMRLVNWASRRPLEDVGFLIPLDVLGVNLRGLYILQGLWIFLCAVMVYFLARRIFGGERFLGLATALLFLIYPVDSTRAWLIQGYTWLICLATLAALYLLMDFAERGGWMRLGAALGLVILPLGAYEAQLGLVLVGGALLAIWSPHGKRARRWALAGGPLLIGVLFVLWRVWIQPGLLHTHDPYLTSMSVSPLALLARLLGAFPVFFTAWFAPFAAFLHISIKRLLLVALGLAAVGLGLALEANRSSAADGLPRLTWREKLPPVRRLLGVVGLGVALLLAGYIPIFTVYAPNLEGVSSRANLFAIPGGALALTALLAAAAWLVARRRQQVPLLLSAAVIPLVLTGLFLQVWNQSEARAAWLEQAHLWHATFDTLPGLRDDATLVFVQRAEEARRPFARLFLVAPWEADGAVQILYNNPSLHGMLYDRSGRWGSAVLKEDGLHDPLNSAMLTPYARVIFVEYDPARGALHVLRHPREELQLPFAPRGYAPEQNIRVFAPASAVYRYLVP